MESASTILSAGAVVADKYAVEAEVPSADGVSWFVGTDQSTGARVLLHTTSQSEAAAIEPAKNVVHQHLAKVFDVIESDGHFVVVQEHVPGETLHARLEAVSTKTPVDAVRSTLRIVDVLSNLHQAGGAHGTIRPASVIVAPDGRPGPVLLFAPPEAAPGPFQSPERQGGGPPTAADDSWAAAALLFTMLKGDPPDASGVSAEQLEAAGVNDEALREVLDHGLSTDPATRSESITKMKRELARWFVDHAGDEEEPLPVSGGQSPSKPPPLPPGAASSAPPPLQAPISGVAASTKPPPAKSSRPLVIGLVFGALVFGVGGAWLFSSLSSKPEVVEVPVAKSAAAPSAQEVDLAAVPVLGSKETSSCVSALLPKDAFKETPDLEWICEQSDALDGVTKLKVEVVKGAGGEVTEANKIFAKLGWYELAVYATLYAGCCADANSLEFPEADEGCDPVQKAAPELGIAVVDGTDSSAALEQFTKAVECEGKANRAGTFRQKAPPTSAEAEAFAEYVKAIQP